MKSGWWCNNHLEKYKFVNGKDYPIFMENEKNVPNHQPEMAHLNRASCDKLFSRVASGVIKHGLLENPLTHFV